MKIEWQTLEVPFALSRQILVDINEYESQNDMKDKQGYGTISGTTDETWTCVLNCLQEISETGKLPSEI